MSHEKFELDKNYLELCNPKRDKDKKNLFIDSDRIKYIILNRLKLFSAYFIRE